jgi:hypothetical protein
MSFQSVIWSVVVLALAAAPAAADGKARLAQEAAEFILGKFGREAVKDTAQVLARRIEQAALSHGDVVFQAVRRAGPQGLHLIEQAGAANGKQIARLLAVHGEQGAVYVASRPQALQLVLRHGEEAAAALVKSRGVAQPAIESLGKPAVRAFSSLGTPQNTRRLAMLAADGGELAAIGRTPEVLGVIAKYGDPALEFVWRHKGALATTAVLTAFLADPEPFINGAKDITQVVTENMVKPLAEMPAITAKEAAAEVARRTNWTLVFLAPVIVLTLLLAARWRRWRRPQRITMTNVKVPHTTPTREGEMSMPRTLSALLLTLLALLGLSAGVHPACAGEDNKLPIDGRWKLKATLDDLSVEFPVTIQNGELRVPDQKFYWKNLRLAPNSRSRYTATMVSPGILWGTREDPVEFYLDADGVLHHDDSKLSPLFRCVAVMTLRRP